MPSNQSQASEFASYNSYWQFVRHVRSGNRFIRDDVVEHFLQAVRATMTKKAVSIPSGTILYRAQIGLEKHVEFDELGNSIGPIAFGPDRMKPDENSVREGRVNPSGIAVLYLASSPDAAVSEVRPWIGMDVSVATFEVQRDLSVICTQTPEGKQLFGGLNLEQITGKSPISAEERAAAVWGEIDKAFAQPVTLDEDPAGYAPTQILSELFRSEGYDGVVYRSALVTDASNFALFDVTDADAIEGSPYTVRSIQVESGPSGVSWRL